MLLLMVIGYNIFLALYSCLMKFTSEVINKTREEFKQKLIQISKDTDETLDMEKGWCEAHDLVCDFLDELGYHEEANIFRDLIWYE